MKIQGIDISEYQNATAPVDFKQVKASGVDFVMVRAGWCGVQGEMHFDNGLSRTIDDAVQAGLDVGLYVYSYAKSVEAAGRAANETIKLAREHTIRYPIAFDVEDTSLINSLTPAEITNTVRAFCSAVQRQKYYPMYYTYLYFTKSYLEMDRLEDYDLWLAYYTEHNDYSGPYGMWQYIGDAGRCPGVQGPCDRDIAYKDYAAIIREAGLNGLEKEGQPQGQPGGEEGPGSSHPEEAPGQTQPPPPQGEPANPDKNDGKGNGETGLEELFGDLLGQLEKWKEEVEKEAASIIDKLKAVL